MKKLAKLLMCVLCAAIVFCSSAAFIACGGDEKTEKITISGSSSVTPLMEELRKVYLASHKNVRITISTSDSGKGITDANDGLNDFGMSSRALKAADGEGVEGINLCMDGIALIVKSNCSVDSVTKDQVKGLFESGTAIGVIKSGIGREAGSGTRGAFDKLIFNVDAATYGPSVATSNATGQVISSISGADDENGTKYALGYISAGSLGSTVKALKYQETATDTAVECTAANIKSGAYKLQRPFVIVLKKGKKLSAAAQAFYDYIMSDAAQSVITGKGYISIKN